VERVFLDANVLFSAAYRADAGLRRLWDLAGVRLVTSAYALEEARRNLETRERLARLDGLSAALELVAEVEGVPDLGAAVDLPRDDQPILGAALAAGCSVLLSGDRRAFGSLYGQRVGATLIQRPGDFLRSR
jgi:hypothetical protein